MNILLISPKYLPIFNKNNEGAIEKLERIYLKYNESQDDHFTIYSPKIAEDNFDHENLKNCSFRNIDTTTLNYKLKKYLYSLKRRIKGEQNNELYIRQIIKDLKKRQEENRYDLIIFENGEQDLPIFRKLIHTNTKVVLHLHNDYLNHYTKNSKAIVESTDEFWTVSNFIGDRIKGVSDDSKTFTLYNTWSFEQQKHIAPVKTQKEPKTVTLLYVGRIIESKGVKDLILAFRKAYKANPNLELLVAGKAESDKKSQDYLAKCRYLAKGYPIQFLGYVPPKKLTSVYQKADIQVVPSKWNEAFGLILLEGMSHNLRIITTGTGGIKEIGKDLVTYVDKDNLITNLTSAILQESKKPPLSPDYYKTVLEEFSETNYCQRFHGLIHKDSTTPKHLGIITFAKSENYGAFLQAFALQSTLKNLGYQPSFIDYETPADIKRYKLIKANNLKSLIKSLILLPQNYRRKAAFKKAQKNLTFTPLTSPYDITITGSDQVWNPELSNKILDPIFFLENINTNKKITYAVSVGNTANVKKYQKTYRKYLPNFSAISVREQSAKTALSPLTKTPISVTLDPTLLLESQTWLSIIRHLPTTTEEYIATYFIGGITPIQKRALETISESQSLKVLSYSEVKKEKNVLKHCYTDSPFTFLARLRDAKLILTSSFHGTVFSIIFHKNFYVLLPNSKKRSRIDDLLNSLGLKDRIIESAQDLDKINLKDIDYTESDKKLAKLRRNSLAWLKTALEEDNQ